MQIDGQQRGELTRREITAIAANQLQDGSANERKVLCPLRRACVQSDLARTAQLDDFLFGLGGLGLNVSDIFFSVRAMFSTPVLISIPNDISPFPIGSKPRSILKENKFSTISNPSHRQDLQPIATKNSGWPGNLPCVG